MTGGPHGHETLRRDGIDYGDYIEPITYRLFLNTADERGIVGPKGCDWPTLRDKAGSGLTDFDVDLLRVLARQPGMLANIIANSQSRFNNPVNLRKLINLIDETEWTSLVVDVKVAACERLLEAGGARLDAIDDCPVVPAPDDETIVEHPDWKPGPGKLPKASVDLRSDLSRSWMVGDRSSDVLAGVNAG